MEVVVTGGCSWSDVKYGDGKLPKDVFSSSWVEQIDFGTDVKFIHVGKSGNSISRSIDHIKDVLFREKKVDKVVLGLTEWLRFPLAAGCLNITIAYYVDKMKKEGKWDEFTHGQKETADQAFTYYNHVESIDKLGVDIFKKIIDTNIRQVLALIELCKLKGIELYIMQVLDAVRPIVGEEYLEQMMGHIIDHEQWNMIANSRKDFTAIGWPFFYPIGGTSAESLLSEGNIWERRNRIHRISHQDSHPNNEGHKIIAKWFNKHV